MNMNRTKLDTDRAIRTRRTLIKGAALGIGMWLTGVRAQSEYPSRPLSMIVPFVPGGPTDIIARMISPLLGNRLGQSVVVQNRAGAGAIVGTEYVARAAPDGYTLLLGTIGTHGINSGIYKKLPYDPINDFAPISLVANVTNLLVVNPSVPAHNLKELIALARAHPGQLTFASAGVGSSQHLAGELFKSMAHIDILHVPYKGGGQAIVDVLGDKISMMFIGIPTVHSTVTAGKLRAIAVTTPQRSPVMPEVPTMAESGVPGYEVGAWHGLFAPAGTPRPIIDKLNDNLHEVLALPEIKTKLEGLGAVPLQSTPEELEAYAKSEIEKFVNLVREAHIPQH